MTQDLSTSALPERQSTLKCGAKRSGLPLSTSAAPEQAPIYKKRWFIVVAAVIVIVLVVSLLPYALPGPPASPEQVELNRAIAYIGASYNITVGLVPQVGNGSTYTLYPDNYVVALAAERYSSSNQTTLDFGDAIFAALGGYASTLPGPETQSAYTALNSTVASFDCPQAYSLGWSPSGTAAPVNGSAGLKTIANDGSSTCASQNYANLLLLQSLWWYKSGNQSEALKIFAEGAGDFDGKGIADLPYSSPSSPSYENYQTDNLALFIYATSCLGQSASNPTFNGAVSILNSLQDNSTGGFYTEYNAALQPTSATSTGTTALAVLALELVVNPSLSC